MKHKDSARCRRAVEHAKDAISALYAEFRYPCSHGWHRSSVRQCNLLTHLQAEKRSTQAKSSFFRKSANRIPCLWMKDNRPHKTTVSNLRPTAPALRAVVYKGMAVVLQEIGRAHV